jgi:hypothetical protein
VSDGNGVGKRPPGESGPGRPHGVGSVETPGALDRDCYGHLSWVADRVRWAGAYVVATQGNFMRHMAVLRASDMRVLFERDFGNSGALVISDPQVPAVVVYNPRRAAWEWVNLTDRSLLDPLDLDPPIIFPVHDSKTFEGQRVLSLIHDHVPLAGEVKVMVLPVIEPGQTYNESDVGKLGALMQRLLFEPANAYYRENSFAQSSLTFRMFGLDVGPTGGPLTLPKPVTSYFWPGFFPGGVELVRTTTGPGTRIVFEGGETLTLHAQPHSGGGQAHDFTLRFCALSLVSEHDAFPVKLAFTGTETATVKTKDRVAASRSITLKFPAQTIQIAQKTLDVDLNALADFLDGLIAAGETAAGVTGGRIFAKPIVERVLKKGLECGQIHVKLEFNPGISAGPGRAEITSVTSSPELSQIGFGTEIAGAFNLGAGAPDFLETYLVRLLEEAQDENGFIFSGRIFSNIVPISKVGVSLSTKILLSDDDGGPNASISVLSSSGLGDLFDTSHPLMGSESTKNLANAPRDDNAMFDAAFTAAISRVLAQPGAPGDVSGVFNGFNVVIVGIIGSPLGAPPEDQWNGAGPVGIDFLREVEKPYTATYHPPVEAGVMLQLKAIWIIQFLSGGSMAGGLCHELGHAYGFRDLYPETQYRTDLQYLSNWSIMAGDGSSLSHHAGYHKWQAGWIPEARIEDVPKPDPAGPITREMLLVPVEYWDDRIEADARAAFGGSSLKVVQLVRIDLGGDGGIFDLIEARQRLDPPHFSQNLPTPRALIATNAVEPYDDTRYALNGLYRAELHLLNTGVDLTKDGDQFDFARAPGLPAKGIKAEIVKVHGVPRPIGAVQIFHVRVTREQAAYVDLGFTSANPYYQNPDVWIDWPGDNKPGEEHDKHPPGEPTDQGDTVHVPQKPPPDFEPHWIAARVWNFGTFDALNVKVDFLVCRPPGSGDRGKNWELLGHGKADVVGAGASSEVTLSWGVQSTDNLHSCLLARIADYQIPKGEDGAALASADVWVANNHAQKNFDQFVAANHSPYEPIEFDYSVNNDGVSPERAYLEPQDLPYGMRLTISPSRRVIAPKETAIFHCTLELDDRIIDAGCRNDREFALVTWRMRRDAAERWGACHYKIRPRKATRTTIEGTWMSGGVTLYGTVTPDPGGGLVRLRINFDNASTSWLPVQLQPGGGYAAQLPPPPGARSLATEALYEGSAILAPSRSPPYDLFPSILK